MFRSFDMHGVKKISDLARSTQLGLPDHLLMDIWIYWGLSLHICVSDLII